MLVEKIVATEGTLSSGIVAETLKTLGFETDGEVLAKALRGRLYTISDAPFAALADALTPSALISGLGDLGVEPVFIAIACKRMAAVGGTPTPALVAEVEKAYHDYISTVVGKG